MTIVRRILIATLAVVLSAPLAHAQVQTGSITGMVTDASGAILPGVSITLTGERLIGGPQTQVTDTSGTYRFDRLVPGSYNVKFELQGFRTVDRPNVIINASFVATINGKMEVGQVSETITVTGESPTVDVRSNVQQTVMSQEILEGIPTGRDPWSLAKLIPGVQVATYDVGGTQSMQQSSLSAHGSNTADVSYNIDGATVNWPGGGGGATMIYYDQGMFEEVNYMTSAIPAEMMAGGVSINMVTKDGGNQWRGQLPYNFSNQDLQSENWAATQALNPNFRGNPTLKTYDMNLSGGGKLIENRVWINGTIRRWIVNKYVSNLNPDGTQALDDNTLKNYSGKIVAQLTTNNKVTAGYFWNDKIRGHRRDGSNRIPDIASVHQINPVQTTQLKYTGIRNRLVFESNFSVMDGITHYTYQPDTPADADPQDRQRSRGSVLCVGPRGQAAEFTAPVRQRLQLRHERLRRRAPVQGRRAVGPSVVRVVLQRAGRSPPELQQRCAGVGQPVQHPGSPAERRHGHRLLLPGFVVDEPVDAEPRRPL